MGGKHVRRRAVFNGVRRTARYDRRRRVAAFEKGFPMRPSLRVCACLAIVCSLALSTFAQQAQPTTTAASSDEIGDIPHANNSGVSDGRSEFHFSFRQPPGVGPAAKLILTFPAETREIRIPFEFGQPPAKP
jgi:hypothetical protein